ncbi:hypothetical protein LTR22_009212 [Elasticomyces elasticus]|nr:hypothetical protein LTR22_009212 [Elasticomyces elasticus]KAK4922466.1 hypothetical protein LTR49_010166 [Elasticomyces elasticus]KAK5760553.1 hypothetical protein LTS12_009262 [Elasticomyces elasticus]
MSTISPHEKKLGLLSLPDEVLLQILIDVAPHLQDPQRLDHSPFALHGPYGRFQGSMLVNRRLFRLGTEISLCSFVHKAQMMYTYTTLANVEEIDPTEQQYCCLPLPLAHNSLRRMRLDVTMNGSEFPPTFPKDVKGYLERFAALREVEIVMLVGVYRPKEVIAEHAQRMWEAVREWMEERPDARPVRRSAKATAWYLGSCSGAPMWKSDETD